MSTIGLGNMTVMKDLVDDMGTLETHFSRDDDYEDELEIHSIVPSSILKSSDEDCDQQTIRPKKGEECSDDHPSYEKEDYHNDLQSSGEKEKSVLEITTVSKHASEIEAMKESQNDYEAGHGTVEKHLKGIKELVNPTNVGRN